MKKLLALLLVTLVFTACKNEAKTENLSEAEKAKAALNCKTPKQSDGLTLLKGDFIYYADAAVLQTHKEVYGVVIDEKMHELDKQTQAYKKDPTDMVTVTVRGKISPKPEGEEGWPFRLEIKEILKVEKINPDDNDVIKLGS